MIALLKGSSDTVDKVSELVKKGEPIATTIITAYELLKGAYISSRREENLSDVRAALSNIQVLDLSPEACEEAANIHCELKKSGKLISEFDVLIASIAKTNNEAILTIDQHFRSVKGLELVR
jgi:tRNA(fMet)-specific endonuclease VapC